MKCFMRGCKIRHASVRNAAEYHEGHGEMHSPNVCPLDYHYIPPTFDRREGTRKPDLEYYDRRIR